MIVTSSTGIKRVNLCYIRRVNVIRIVRRTGQLFSSDQTILLFSMHGITRKNFDSKNV